MYGLGIVNFEGFSDVDVMNLGEIVIELDIGSVGKDVLVINEVLVGDI